MKSYLTEAGKACSEHRHLITTVDTSKWELADAEKELKWLRGAISSSEKEFEQNQRKVTELQRDLDRERYDSFLLEFANWSQLLIHKAYCIQ